MLSLPIELPTTCSLATELSSLPIQWKLSCLFCLQYVHWLLSCLLFLFSWNGAANSAYCFIGYWVAYSAYSMGTARELSIVPTKCSLAGIELGTSSSRGMCNYHWANHALHGLLLKKRTCSRREQIFPRWVAPLWKGTKNQGSDFKLCFQQNALDHGQVNSNVLDWAANARFIPLWYHMVIYW